MKDTIKLVALEIARQALKGRVEDLTWLDLELVFEKVKEAKNEEKQVLRGPFC